MNDQETNGATEVKSLLEMMNADFAEEVTPAEIQQDSSEAPKAKQQEAQIEAENAPVAAESDPLDDGEGFFAEDDPEPSSGNSEAKPDGTFDEAGFDKATEAILKKLEEKGHPGDAYKELREELKELKKKSLAAEIPAETKAEIERLKSYEEENKGLKERISELSNVSAQTKMENSEKFQNEVLNPARNIIEICDQISEGYTGGETEEGKEVIREIVRLGDRKAQNQAILDKLGSLSEFDRSEVYKLCSEYRTLQLKRNDLLKNAQNEIDKLELDRLRAETEHAEESKKAFKTIQTDIWEKYKGKIEGLVDDSGEETEDMKSLRAKAMSVDFAKAKGKDLAWAAFSGYVLPYAVKRMNEMRVKIVEMEKQLGRKSKQMATTGGAISGSGGEVQVESGGLLGDFLKQRF